MQAVTHERQSRNENQQPAALLDFYRHVFSSRARFNCSLSKIDRVPLVVQQQGHRPQAIGHRKTSLPSAHALGSVIMRLRRLILVPHASLVELNTNY
jgi:hypothetical protein